MLEIHLEISFGTLIWKSRLELLFGNLVWEFRLEISFGTLLSDKAKTETIEKQWVTDNKSIQWLYHKELSAAKYCIIKLKGDKYYEMKS